jgi:hypothetical protein
VSLVLVIAGFIIAGIGVWFVYIEKGTSKAGGGGMGIKVQANVAFLMIAAGLAVAVYGVVLWNERHPPPEKAVEDREEVSTVPPTIPEEIAEAEPADVEQLVEEFFPTGFTLGDNNDLDKLWRECGRGIWVSCDDLYLQADFDSEYEYFGATCGQPDFLVPSELWCDPQRNIEEGLLTP